MRQIALAVTLLFATVAAAEELYVPLGGGRSRTELEIVNASQHAVSVDLEVLGAKATRIELAAGERVRWADPPADDPGMLRIAGDAGLQVTAVRYCDACGTSASVPVVAASRTVDEAEVAVRTDGRWRSGLLIVNPRDAAAVVTVDGAVQVLAPHGVLRGSTFRAETPLLAFAYDVNDATGARVFTAIAPHAMTRKRRAVRSGFPEIQPQPQTVVLAPSKDNTLYQSGSGSTSNGKGAHTFSGATASRGVRRALLAFDVAAQVPPGSRITRVTLALHVSMTIADPQTMALRRVTADWGEGTSNAGSSRDGDGAAAQPGDATWLHTFSPDRRWSRIGGDFETDADATASVGASSGVWESAAMITRVQQWLDQPATNFGWIVIGDESGTTTTKRFDSREVSTAVTRPALTIELLR
jgi:hypothetical protein